MLWEAADPVHGKRLKPWVPMVIGARERHGHLDLDPVIETHVLQVSAATIDRLLVATRAHRDGPRKWRKGMGSAIHRMNYQHMKDTLEANGFVANTNESENDLREAARANLPDGTTDKHEINNTRYQQSPMSLICQARRKS